MSNINNFEQLNNLEYTPERFFWEVLKAGMHHKLIKINDACRVRNSYDYSKTEEVSSYLYENFKDRPADALRYLLDTPASEVLAGVEQDKVGNM